MNNEVKRELLIVLVWTFITVFGYFFIGFLESIF